MLSRPSSVFWRIFYNFLVVPLMFGGFQFTALLARLGFSRFDKIHSGLDGRKNLFAELEQQLAPLPGSCPRFWVHASSMGEYEQARPLLQEIKQRFPEAVRVLTFFSPSAYTNINRAHIPAEVVSYLPFDSLANARRFVQLVNPAAAIIIRHDFWPNHLWQAQKRGAALLLANASVSANARSFRHWPLVRQFNRAVFDTFDAVCAVSAAAAKSFAPLVRHSERLLITGDSRFDQVLFRSQSKKIDDVLPDSWRQGAPIFVAGSTWPSDEEVLLPAFVVVRKNVPLLRMILVPHEPTPEHLAQLEKQLASLGLSSVRLSRCEEEREVGGEREKGGKGDGESGGVGEREKGRQSEGEKGGKGDGEKEREGEREKGREGEWARGRVGERERGRWGEEEKSQNVTHSPTLPLTPSILLVDRIGVLAILYSAGQVAFVGGSFGPGVHSVLEAAVHGVPVLTGPRFRNSPEAAELVEKKLLTPVAAIEECQKVLLDFFQNPTLCEEKGRQHRDFVLARCGAATKILDRLVELLHTDHRLPMSSR